MISNAQKAVLHVAKAQLHLDDEMYRAILREQAEVGSSTELTNDGFDKVMRRLEELGFQNTARKARRWSKPSPQSAITAEQQALIRELYSQLGWTEMPRQIGFNKRCCGKSWPQTRTHANKVIEGLKAICGRLGDARN